MNIEDALAWRLTERNCVQDALERHTKMKGGVSIRTNVKVKAFKNAVFFVESALDLSW